MARFDLEGNPAVFGLVDGLSVLRHRKRRMIVYLVVSQSVPAPPALESAIGQHFKDHSYRVNSATWLVASKKTARGLCDELGITDGRNGTALVTAVGDYFGRMSRDVWPWIKSNLETEA